MTAISSPINPEYIDGEVVKLLRKMPGLSIPSIYYELKHLPETLVYCSIKRLQESEVIGFCLIDGKEFVQDESKSEEEFVQDESTPEDHNDSSGRIIRLKIYTPKGTARGDKQYYAVYLDNEFVIHLGGGNTETPLAQRRKTEFEHLVSIGVIHPDLPDEEIKRLVRGIQARNMRFDHE